MTHIPMIQVIPIMVSGTPMKPKGFKANRPSGLKLGLATGPGAVCGADVKSWPKPKKPLIL